MVVRNAFTPSSLVTGEASALALIAILLIHVAYEPFETDAAIDLCAWCAATFRSIASWQFIVVPPVGHRNPAIPAPYNFDVLASKNVIADWYAYTVAIVVRSVCVYILLPYGETNMIVNLIPNAPTGTVTVATALVPALKVGAAVFATAYTAQLPELSLALYATFSTVLSGAPPP